MDHFLRTNRGRNASWFFYFLRKIYNEYIEVKLISNWRRKPIMKKFIFILMAVLALRTGYGFESVAEDVEVVYDYNNYEA